MKLLAVCPNPNDITALYRVMGPLGTLHREDKIELTVNDKLDYLQFSLNDAILIQRPASKPFLDFCYFVKNWNKPLILDYDDDLLNVPLDNPASEFFNNPQTKDCIIKSLEIADLCIVSTEALKKSYEKYCKNVVVIPNGLDINSLPQRDINWKTRSPFITWRGGSTHEPDVFTVRDQILNLSKENKDWKFIFMGHDFKWLRWSMTEQAYNYMPKMDPAIYMKKLHTLSSPIHIVPLAINQFNESKSNIAMLEAAWAGSAIVAPNMNEWQDALTYNNPDEFKALIQELINNPNKMKEAHDKTWEAVNERYLLSKINKQRLKILKDIK